MISVILPVRNVRTTLPQLLDELLAQNYPAHRYEILVVDGGSTDGTGDLVRRRYTGRPVAVRVIDHPKRSSAAGRNAGLRAAAGDVMIFMDGRCSVPSRNLLVDTAAILDRRGVACLCRPQPLLAPAATRMGQAIADTSTSWLVRGRHPRSADAEQADFTDPACAGSTYLRRVFYRVGLFDESLDSCEDVEFNTRVRSAGFRAFSDRRLAVHARPYSTLRRYFQEMVRYGRGRKQLTRRHPRSFSSGDMAPFGLVASLLFALVAWRLLPVASALVASLPAMVFGVSILVATAQALVQHGVSTGWRAPLIFAATYVGQGIGVLSEMLVPAKLAEYPLAAELALAGHDGRHSDEGDRAA